MMQILNNKGDADKKNKRLLSDLILSLSDGRDVSDIIADATNIVLSEPKYKGIMRELATAAVADAYAKTLNNRK